MIVNGNKRAEARCRYYVREEAKRLGWDVRHPQAGGRFLEEQEIVDYYPILKPVLGGEKPDFGAIGPDNKLRAVIECKNDVSQLNKAIDEACEYSDRINNADSFDVRFAVGVAGTPDRFVQTRSRFWNKRRWIDLESHDWPLTQLPTLREIEIALTNADGTTDVQLPEESEFADAAVAINNILRSAKIEESARPKVLGAIILALYQGTFALDQDVVLDHINANVKAAIGTFRDVDPPRRDLLTQTLHLSTESYALRDKLEQLVHQLERLNVRSIVRSGVDFLGKFYEAFLRYGADAKSMGIVFTPRHITQFCAELTDVKLPMTVYDPAAGTGGFLVAAFDRMMKQATTDKAKASVRQSIYGCDTNSTVWALAVLNMFFRGDGKSNIQFKSCFYDAEAFAEKFDRVLLNPPFKQDGEPETDFIDHSLNSLKPGGVLGVVVKTTVAVDPKLATWRQRLVDNHHIMGAISLPEDLFYPTAAPTVILVVKAHSPSKTENTFVARIANDGYEISKKRRVSRDGSQLSSVRALFERHQKNGEIHTVAGVACSVARTAISKGEEVCAEQWLPSAPFGMQQYEKYKSDAIRQMSLALTNYPDVTDELIDNYEELLEKLPQKKRPASDTTLEKWFAITVGESSGASDYPAGTVPFVSSGDTYNSIVELVSAPDDEVFSDPCITITGFGHACIQPWRFCARGNGGSAVRIATPKFSMSLAELMWFVGQINHQRWRFHYGRMAIGARLKQLKVQPPLKSIPGIKGLAQRLRTIKMRLAMLSQTETDTSADVAERFRRLSESWRESRGHRSSVAKMAMHADYQQIIGMGRDAVPFLLAEMESRPGHWSWALRAITGEDPVPEEARGRLVETAKAWIKWGRERGYQW